MLLLLEIIMSVINNHIEAVSQILSKQFLNVSRTSEVMYVKNDMIITKKPDGKSVQVKILKRTSSDIEQKILNSGRISIRRKISK